MQRQRLVQGVVFTGCRSLHSVTLCRNKVLSMLNIYFHCPALEAFHSTQSALHSVDFSACSMLKDITSVSSPDLEHVRLPRAGILDRLCLDVSDLNALDLSRCASLKSLRLTEHHSLRGLNLCRLIALQELTLSYNSRLTTLDTRGSRKLKDLLCTYHESLTSLNVSGCTALQRIVCGSNPVLRHLCICGCSKLRSIGAEHCQLGELDTSFCPSLVEVPSPSQW